MSRLLQIGIPCFEGSVETALEMQSCRVSTRVTRDHERANEANTGMCLVSFLLREKLNSALAVYVGYVRASEIQSRA